MTDIDLNTVDPRTLSTEQFRNLLDAATRSTPNLSAVDPQAFARLIARASTAQIEAVNARADLRDQVLDEIFARMRTQFRADRGAGADAVVHWRIGDRPGGGHDEFEMVIADAACATSRGRRREPRASLQMGIVTFLRLVSGNASAPMLFLRGRLTVRGDLAFAAGMLNLFDIPRP